MFTFAGEKESPPRLLAESGLPDGSERPPLRSGNGEHGHGQHKTRENEKRKPPGLNLRGIVTSKF
jgi:hypothetical protein